MVTTHQTRPTIRDYSGPLFDLFVNSLSSIPSEKKAIWEEIDDRKREKLFFPNVHPSDKVGFIINNKKQMLSYFLKKDERKFYLHFYWLATQYSAGYISQRGLSFPELEKLAAHFVPGQLSLNNAVAATVGLQPVISDHETFSRDNQIYKETMAETFNVPDFIQHVHDVCR